MASSMLLISLFFLFSFQLSQSSIHDLLLSRGLPAGLFPKDTKSYTLSNTGLLEVYIGHPCLTKFDTMAFYESVVRANLTYGSLKGVVGFSQEELFLWLPVIDISVVDPMSGLILFDIGLAHKQISLSLFEDPRDCKRDDNGYELPNGGCIYPWFCGNKGALLKTNIRDEQRFEA